MSIECVCLSFNRKGREGDHSYLINGALVPRSEIHLSSLQSSVFTTTAIEQKKKEILLVQLLLINLEAPPHQRHCDYTDCMEESY